MRKNKPSVQINHFVKVELDGLAKCLSTQFQDFLKEELHVDSLESVEIVSTPDSVVFKPDSEVLNAVFSV